MKSALNLMLNKWKTKKAAGAPPQTLPWEGARPLPYPPLHEFNLRPPLPEFLDPPLHTYYKLSTCRLPEENDEGDVKVERTAKLLTVPWTLIVECNHNSKK